jgi:hypothetical protein
VGRNATGSEFMAGVWTVDLIRIAGTPGAAFNQRGFTPVAPTVRVLDTTFSGGDAFTFTAVNSSPLESGGSVSITSSGEMGLDLPDGARSFDDVGYYYLVPTELVLVVVFSMDSAETMFGGAVSAAPKNQSARLTDVIGSSARHAWTPRPACGEAICL